MGKILLAQPILPEDWRDLSVGEPHVIRDILFNELNINLCLPSLKSNDFIYPSPCGYDDLVRLLENKHGGKVVITNGAKQGLGAALYASSKMGAKKVWTPTPYWALLPPLFDLHGLGFEKAVPGTDAVCLAVSPNNPDGNILNLSMYEIICKRRNALMIHDAAYYTNIYMKKIDKKVYGDAQVYSISKMFGLSSLRLGYVVCKNEEMYNHIQFYMEHMTVGVSKLPQMFLFNIMNSINMNSFEKKCFQALECNKEIVKQINPSIMDVPTENIPGMFLWGRVKDYDAFKRAKLHVIDGEPFGKKDFVRINLAFKQDVMFEIVDRLNNA